MSVQILDEEILTEVLAAARLTPQELRVELAVHLFEQDKLSLGKARQLADMTIWQFMQLLGSRGIPIHYDIAEYEQDLATLKRLERL
jgi:predicted HTH domain antitoxin